MAAIQYQSRLKRGFSTCRGNLDDVSLPSATGHLQLPAAVIDSMGMEADLHNYYPRSVGWSRTREVGVQLKALMNVVRREPPPPVLGEPALLGALTKESSVIDRQV